MARVWHACRHGQGFGWALMIKVPHQLRNLLPFEVPRLSKKTICPKSFYHKEGEELLHTSYLSEVSIKLSEVTKSNSFRVHFHSLNNEDQRQNYSMR
jgi:hypothetical protein